MFNNISDWQLITNIQSVNLSIRDILIINSDDVPHIFTSPIIAYSVSTSNQHWYKAGYLVQTLPAPIELGSVLQGEALFIKLFTPTIHKFNRFTAGYNLVFKVPLYFSDVTFSIWEYKQLV